MNFWGKLWTDRWTDRVDFIEPCGSARVQKVKFVFSQLNERKIHITLNLYKKPFKKTSGSLFAIQLISDFIHFCHIKTASNLVLYKKAIWKLNIIKIPSILYCQWYVIKTNNWLMLKLTWVVFIRVNLFTKTCFKGFQNSYPTGTF